jgi:hypothetical protein
LKLCNFLLSLIYVCVLGMYQGYLEILEGRVILYVPDREMAQENRSKAGMVGVLWRETSSRSTSFLSYSLHSKMATFAFPSMKLGFLSYNTGYLLCSGL